MIEKREKLREAKEKHDKTNIESGIRLGESITGMRGLYFSVDMIRRRSFPHHSDEKIIGTINKNLEHNGYSIVRFKLNGNSFPKSIALRVYNDQNEHENVRREVK